MTPLKICTLLIILFSNIKGDMLYVSSILNNPSFDRTYYLEIENTNDATMEIYNALYKCKTENYSKLSIKKGVYHVNGTRAFEKYVAVSNADNGMKRIIFPLDNIKDFEIDANGSLFICHGKVQVFELEETSNITIKNVSVDWEKPFYLQGEVINVNESENSYDIKIMDECDAKIVNNELLFYDSEIKRPEDQWLQDVNWSEFFEPERRGVVNNSPIYEPDSSKEGFKVSKLSERVYRLMNASKKLPRVGWILICKGIRNNNTTNRSSSIIHINRSNNISIENVTIHTCSGIGLVAERSSDIFIDKLQVRLPDNSERMVTTTADATHFVGCKGKIEIKNSFFENVLDDISNIHGDYSRILDIINDNTIGVQLTHQHQLKVEIAGKGDEMRFVNSDFLPIAVRKVKSVDFRNSAYVIVEFEGEIKSLMEGKAKWIENLTWNPDSYVFSGNMVKNNRGRGVCVSSLGEIIIENNLFENNSMQAIRFTGDLEKWYTSSPVENVVVRNNKIISYNEFPSITLTPRIECKSKPVDYYNKNVTIEGNTIMSSSYNILSASHIENLKFLNNKILPNNNDIQNSANNAAIKFNCVKNVLIENNVSNFSKVLSVVTNNSLNVISQKNTGIQKIKE